MAVLPSFRGLPLIAITFVIYTSRHVPGTVAYPFAIFLQASPDIVK